VLAEAAAAQLLPVVDGTEDDDGIGEEEEDVKSAVPRGDGTVNELVELGSSLMLL